MISSHNYNLEIIQGDSFQKAYVAVIDEDGVETPFDFTGYSFKGQIKKNHNSSSAVDFNITTADSGTGAVDTIILSLDSTVTEKMNPCKYIYDVQWIDGENNIETYMSGEFIVKGQVTEND